VTRAEDDDGDDESPVAADGSAAFVPVALALEQSGFTVAQLRALVGAGIIKTQRVKGVLVYCVEDLMRLCGMPRVAEPEEPSPLIAEFNAVTAGYRSLLEVALKQTKQSQDHERALIQAFSKPLENLGDSSKALVTAVLDQNKQLVTRANDGDSARLSFVQAAETMLRDQRAELRDQAEADRKHSLRASMWEDVKKAAPRLLEGWKATTGADRIEAATALAAKLDPAKVAALIHYRLLADEEIDLLCKALGLDRAAIEKMNADADAAATEPPPPPEPETEAQAAE
jgi:hypothetical protein